MEQFSLKQPSAAVVQNVVQEDNHIQPEAPAQPFGIFEYDLKSNSAFWSEGLYGILGYGAEDRPQISSGLMLAHIAPAFAERFNQQVEAKHAAGEEYTGNYEIITKSGERRRVVISGCMITGNDGEALRHCGQVHLSALPHEEAATLHHINELERSNSELEGFAYVASHDMQEPLRKIATFATRLSDKCKDKFQPEDNIYIERIISSANNMRKLIDSLLEYSLISKTTFAPQEVSLGFCTRQAVAELELQIEETGASVKVAQLPVVKGIAAQLQQLFFNLLNNAIKFRKPGVAPVISITTEKPLPDTLSRLKLSPARDYVQINICDNGIGFDEEYAARIFEVFQRLHSKAEYPGSGIGLAICKRIAEQHGGSIFATRNEGEGACFHLVLPQ